MLGAVAFSQGLAQIHGAAAVERVHAYMPVDMRLPATERDGRLPPGLQALRYGQRGGIAGRDDADCRGPTEMRISDLQRALGGLGRVTLAMLPGSSAQVISGSTQPSGNSNVGMGGVM